MNINNNFELSPSELKLVPPRQHFQIGIVNKILSFLHKIVERLNNKYDFEELKVGNGVLDFSFRTIPRSDCKMNLNPAASRQMHCTMAVGAVA